MRSSRAPGLARSEGLPIPPRSRRRISGANCYFDDQAAGLGGKFVTDVETMVTDIRMYPESGTQVSPNLRKRILRVFKHTVFYVNAPEEIIIVAVAAQRRRPGYWRRRLKDLRDG